MLTFQQKSAQTFACLFHSGRHFKFNNTGYLLILSLKLFFLSMEPGKETWLPVNIFQRPTSRHHQFVQIFVTKDYDNMYAMQG